MTLHHTPPTISCATTWPASPQMIGGTIPSGLSPGSLVSVIWSKLDIELDYFMQIHTQ